MIPIKLVEEHRLQLIELAKDALDLKDELERRLAVVVSDPVDFPRLRQQKVELVKKLNGWFTQLESLETQPSNTSVSSEILSQIQADQQALHNLREHLRAKPESLQVAQSNRLQKTRRLRVFLCWAWVNRTLAQTLHQQLLTDGMESWFDIQLGQNRKVEVPRMLRSSDVLLVLLSSTALTPSGDLPENFTSILDFAEKQPSGSLAQITLLLYRSDLPARLEAHSFLNYAGPEDYPHLKQALTDHAARRGLEVPTLENQDQHKISDLLTQLDEAESKKEWDRVIEAGEALLKLTNTQESVIRKTVNGYLNRGLAYAGLQQYQRAIQDYDRAFQLKPDLAAYLSRGNAYYHLEQYQSAIQDYNQVIQLKPDYAHAYYNRGLCHRGLNNKELARRDFQQASELGLEVARKRLAEL